MMIHIIFDVDRNLVVGAYKREERAEEIAKAEVKNYRIFSMLLN